MVKIDKKIVNWSVTKPDADPPPPPAKPSVPEPLPTRPKVLDGKTYKVRTPMTEHALYVTFTHIDTPTGVRPYEMFISCKAMEHFQWIVALTRIVSAIFRRTNEDCRFLVEELRSVFDPRGGHFAQGGKFVPSLVAELGNVLAEHLTSLGLYEEDTSLADAAQAMVAEKTAKAGPTEESTYPPNASICTKCGAKAVVIQEGCGVCLQCHYSRCG